MSKNIKEVFFKSLLFRVCIGIYAIFFVLFSIFYYLKGDNSKSVNPCCQEQGTSSTQSIQPNASGWDDFKAGSKSGGLFDFKSSDSDKQYQSQGNNEIKEAQVQMNRDTVSKIEDYLTIKANLYATKNLIRKNKDIKIKQSLDVSLEDKALNILNQRDVDQAALQGLVDEYK